jgi:pyruvate/2-oxoglutarate dehydrogenase complex dihydrolipoamide acyltransferase (E2) component
MDIVLPKLSDEDSTEAVVNQWLAAEGDVVDADQDLVEVLTDKVALTLPSPAAGRLAEIRAPVGKKVAFGDVLGTISGR